MNTDSTTVQAPKPTKKKSDEIRAEIKEKLGTLAHLKNVVYRQKEKDLKVQLEALIIGANQDTLNAVKVQDQAKKNSFKKANDAYEAARIKLKRELECTITEARKLWNAEMLVATAERDTAYAKACQVFTEVSNNIESKRNNALAEVRKSNDRSLNEFYKERDEKLSLLQSEIEKLHETLNPVAKPVPGAVTPEPAAEAIA